MNTEVEIIKQDPHLLFAKSLGNPSGTLMTIEAYKYNIQALLEQEKLEGSKEDETTFIEDLLSTLESGGKKSISFIKSPLGNKNKGLLNGINDAGITPNNIVTLRTYVMTPIGIALFASGQKELGILVLLLACAFDKLDGTIAEKFNKKSIAGQLYDAGADKIMEIGISLLATYVLVANGSEIEAIISLILTGLKAYQHYQTQTRKGRPSLKEQGPIFYNSALRDEFTTFIEKKTNGAAGWAGKIKTLFQFSGALLILFTSILLDHFDLGETKSYLNWLSLGLGTSSLGLGYLSGKGKK